MSKTTYLFSCLIAVLSLFNAKKSAAQNTRLNDSYKLIMSFQFDDAKVFSDGLVAVKKGKKWGYINKTGNTVIDFQFDDASTFSDGLAAVKKSNKWGYINKTGNTVIDYQFDNARVFSEGLAEVKKGNRWGYINKTSHLVIDYQFDFVMPFSEGLAMIKKRDKLGIIDKSGQLKVNDNLNYSWSPFSEGLVMVKKGKKLGYANKKGHLVIDYQFDLAKSFSGGLAIVKKSGKYGYIDKTGQTVIDYQFDDAKAFSEGLAWVKKELKWSYIDKTGQAVTDYQFDDARAFSEGLAWVKKGSKWGFIGKELFEDEIKEYVTHNVNLWQKKGKYESTSEYQARVTQENRERVIANFTIKATNHIAARKVDLSNLVTEYDADNEVFKISAVDLLPFYVKVPRTEAEEFDSHIQKLSFQNKIFALGVNNNYILTEAFIKNPANNKSYTIDKEQTLAFGVAQLEMNFEPIEFSVNKIEAKEREERITIVNVGISDIDTNIPVSTIQNENAFALIIGNEEYSSEIAVPFAINDAATFKRYAQKTLGIPDNHIHFISNATYGQMLGEIDWLTNVIKVYQGKAKVYFYYAGHGMPDEATRSAYLLPVDGYSGNQYTSVKLEDIYAGLTKHPAKSVTVFLDACFSGSSRSGMLTTGRGVKIKPKKEIITGNMIVLSASSGAETAHPYTEKTHGLFTYFLLKKLQQTKGNTTWAELAGYVKQNVSKVSVVNNKSQTPSIIISPTLQASWQGRMIK